MHLKAEDGVPLRDINPQIDSSPVFKGQTDRVLRYTVLMFDYDSLYRKMPLPTRRTHVLGSIGLVNEMEREGFLNDNDIALIECEREYTRCQYDIEKEALIACKFLIDEWNTLLKKSEKTDREQAMALKIYDKMPEYLKRLQSLEEIVGERTVVEATEHDDASALEDFLKEQEG
tara:strand:+ start:364 stop:885 length:522 start_codon:yes stop_codon:yes gene_type:complete